MLTDPLNYYTSHSSITDPGDYAALFDDLPTDLPALHQVTQNVLIHNWKVRKYHREWLAGRTQEYELRGIAPLLAKIQAVDSAPLTVERPEEKRLIIDCRHFATLLCAILRHQGIPARVRCGFATYLEDSHYQDHWVCEYWNGDRWVLEDPDLLKHDFPREEFFMGGQAWHLSRSSEMSPDRFGYDPNTRGWWVIRHDLVRDMAALNKFEALSADGWGLMHREEPAITEADNALCDHAAALSLRANDDLDALRAFYDSTPDLRVPPVITVYNYLDNSSRSVEVDVPSR